MPDPHESILEALRAAAASDPPVVMPPAAFDALQVHFKDHHAGRTLLCAFPAQPHFANSAGCVHAGILSAAFDIAFTSLALLETRRPVSPITMEASFVRPLPADGRPFDIQVRIKAKTRSVLFLDGRASNPDGKTVATAGATMSVLKVRPDSGEPASESGIGFGSGTGSGAL